MPKNLRLLGAAVLALGLAASVAAGATRPVHDAATPPAIAAEQPEPVTGFLVAPYLNHPGSDRMTVMFEPEPDSVGPDMYVEVRAAGTTGWARVDAQLEQVQANDAILFNPDRVPSSPDAVMDPPVVTPVIDVYRADLTGLASNTVHEYRVTTAAGVTPVAQFKTWPVEGDGVDRGRFIVFSDVQSQNIDTWFVDVLNAIVEHECNGVPALCVHAIDGIVVPGDLVDSGGELEQWRRDWFGPGDRLFRYLPQIAAMGNHDVPMEPYLYYFSPPANGSNGFEDEWYSLDFMNLTILTMQSNFTSFRLLERYTEQLAWLEAEVADAEAEEMDYLFINVHAPCKSELWIPGESAQVCDFVHALEDWSARTGGISGHLYGHTHAYSRGQSRDVSHLWLNAASAGGAIDDWGDYEMADYDEMEMSWDEYGYVVFEFATTGTPEVAIERHTGGDDHGPHPERFTAGSVRDDITIGGVNQPPATPVAVLPATYAVQVADPTLHAEYTDPEGDPFLEAHWQVRPGDGSWEEPTYDHWGNETRATNIWFRRNLNEGAAIDHWRVPFLDEGEHCWRVRHRDDHWAWSDWSADACFTIANVEVSDDLVTNGGAESATGAPSADGWEVIEGALAASTGTDCNPIDNVEISMTPLTPLIPFEGAQLFVLGGCGSEVADRAKAVQSIDVSAFADDIDAGRAIGVLEAALRTYSKWDVPTARMVARGADGKGLEVSRPLVNQTGEWIREPTSLLLPPGTRSVEVLLTGQRQQGSSNDSFIDAVSFRVATSPVARTAADVPWASPGNGMGIIPAKDWTFPVPSWARGTAP